MKKLATGLLALSLFLVACSQDSDQRKDSNKEKDDKAKIEQQDRKTNDSSKDEKDNKDDNKDVSKDNRDNSASDNQRQSNLNTISSDQNQANNSQSNSGQTVNNQKSSYVALYYGQNVVPVACQAYPFNGNKSQVLQQLPNPQTALNAASSKANKFGNGHEICNDYLIEEHNGNHKYVFSFEDPSVNGKYSIVTVDHTRQAMVTDPNYRQ